MLELKWTYPVQRFTQVENVEAGRTTTRAQRRVLAEREAYYEFAGEDRRPMLVLRECLYCNGTDDALLSKNGGNDRTLIMSRWFRCVKLPMDVVDGDHIFHNVFSGENPPHLLITRWNGDDTRPLLGDQSPSELWDHMETMLKAEYGDDVTKTVREIERILGKYDELDERIARLELAVDGEIEKAGPKSRKAKKLFKDLKKSKDELAALKRKEAELSELALLRPSEGREAIDDELQESER